MRRPQAHVTGELGEAQFTAIMLANGWSVTKLAPDYGFDFLAQPVQDDIVTANYVLFQVKTSATALRVTRDGNRRLQVAMRYVDFWRRVPVPAFCAAVELPSGQVFVANCHQVIAKFEMRSAQRPSSRPAKSVDVVFNQESLLGGSYEVELRMAIETYWETSRAQSFHSLSAIGATVGLLLAPAWSLFALLGAGVLNDRSDYDSRGDSEVLSTDRDHFLSWLRNLMDVKNSAIVPSAPPNSP